MTRSQLIPRALTLAVAVIALAVVIGSALAEARRNAVASPSPAVPTSAGPSAPAAAAPSASPTPLPTGRPAGGIEAYPLGALHGEYAFVLNGGASTSAGAVAEVWAIPLAGGDPHLAVRYVNATTPSTNTGDNVLARQFSPDGQRLVLSAATPRAAGGERVGMFIIDLEAGRLTPLAAEDGAEHEKPAWSPDGRRIAYVKRPIIGNSGTFDEGIWVVNVDGTGARKVPLAPAPAQSEFPAQTFLYSWTPDGRLAWFYLSAQSALILTDVDSGTHTVVRSGVGDVRGLSFRTAVPRIAGSFSDRPGNCPGHYIAVLDGAPERILVRAPEAPQCPRRIHDVRWDPGRDEVLYILEVAPKGELHIRDLSGADQRIASQTEPVLAEWSPTGTHVLYIDRIAQQQFVLPLRGDGLRYVRRDGSDDRMIFTPRGVASLSDLAAKNYQ